MDMYQKKEPLCQQLKLQEEIKTELWNIHGWVLPDMRCVFNL